MRLTRDFVAGTIILGLSAFLWWITTTFDSDPLGMAQGMPATHMPRLILSVIVVLTVLMMVQNAMNGGEEIGGVPPWQMPTTVVILGLAAILFTRLGVPLVFFAICIAIPIVWGSTKYKAIIVFAACIPIAIYVVFKLLLGLRLPMGPLATLGL